MCLSGQTGREPWLSRCQFTSVLTVDLVYSLSAHPLLVYLDVRPICLPTRSSGFGPALSFVPGLGFITQVWSCVAPHHRTPAGLSPHFRFPSWDSLPPWSSVAIPQPTCVTCSIWRGIRDPEFVLVECTKKSTNIWQTAATKLWYLWNRCSINPPHSIEIHKCFIYISDKTCSQQK